MPAGFQNIRHDPTTEPKFITQTRPKGKIVYTNAKDAAWLARKEEKKAPKTSEKGSGMFDTRSTMSGDSKASGSALLGWRR